MSLFRKPKKIQRRVFSSNLDEDEDDDRLDEKEFVLPPPPPIISIEKKPEKKEKSKLSRSDASDTTFKTKSLLSFADDEDEGEMFQVRKSSHSKKVMRMMDKERRKKKKEEREGTQSDLGPPKEQNSSLGRNEGVSISIGTSLSSKQKSTTALSSSTSSCSTAVTTTNAKCNSNKTDSIQTEIRTDDFVLVVKKSEPDVVLNGRAAICAGRNDMSDEEDENHDKNKPKHRFSKPEQLKQMLESGSIPDAAMIHAARKRRQKAREEGEFVSVEEPKPEIVKKGSRLESEDVEGDNSDEEERVDMNAITGVKELEERREQFYSVENDYEDSDRETNDWENQQIRKGVTGAQLVNAQQDAALSRFMISSTPNVIEETKKPQSTKELLDEAYANSPLDNLITKKPQNQKPKPKTALRTPQEITEEILNKINELKEMYTKHVDDIERMENELKILKLDRVDCTEMAPTAAAKYRFYQEVKTYVDDLLDCLNLKVSMIYELDKKVLEVNSKHKNFLVERRRQDVRDQAKEMTDSSKTSISRRVVEYEQHIRRGAEREGRRTRRRCEREKMELQVTHLDGMSSDDETSDQYREQFQSSIEEIYKEAEEVFCDVHEEFHKIELILMKFYAWRKTDIETYKEAFVSLCLPKILSPLVRLELLKWSPLLEESKDVEKMNWFALCTLYALDETETIESLKQDSDSLLIPTIVEKVILSKVTDIVNKCWDPLSTTETLRLIGFVNRIGRDFPINNSKNLKKLFTAILNKIKLSLDNDVFIPIFPKQVQEAKTSFFQRQFCSGLKLFRNILSWQGIISDVTLRELAIGSLLNRYLLLAMRICSANDGIRKAYIIANTLPTVWLQPDSETLNNLQLFIAYIKQTLESCDPKSLMFLQSVDKAKQILQRLHSF